MQRSWLAVGCVGFLAAGGVLAACGSNGDGATFNDEAGVGPGSSSSGDLPDTGQVFSTDADLDTGTGTSCRPKTCTDLGATCGKQGDGCGGIIDCGSCTAPATCGGGGTPSQCGGTNGCVPRTTAYCATINANCGQQSDGCGGLINCGTCTTSGDTCGGGGVNNQCGQGGGDGGVCVPTKTTCAPGECGFIGDGCGGLLNCNGCTAPAICGGGGTPNVCGGATDGGGCVPKTCAQIPANCGAQGDGCGGLITSCGTCTGNETCGGGGVANMCGAGDAGVPCTGLCNQQANCDGGTPTTLTGTVYAPNGVEPLPNVIVYVPNGGPAPSYGVQPFTSGVTSTCTACGADVTGNPLVKTTTGADGKFTLQNVPTGANIPLVIQIGRWRRQVTVPSVTSCVSAPVSATLTRFPKNKAEGDIPLTAMATGSVDTLECVLRKIGIDDTEFTNPSGTGRIHIYQGDPGAQGMGAACGPNAACAGTSTNWNPTLIGTQTQIDKYDQMISACNGDPAQATMTDANRDIIKSYLNRGGRLFATHYEYVWLDAYAPFSQTADWNVDQANRGNNSITGDIDTSFAKGQIFAQWLGVVNSLSNVSPPKITINVSRHDLDPLPNPPGTGVVAPAQRWISVDPKLPNGSNFPNGYPNYVGAPQHYTFNTPWGSPPDQQCGRVLFSDFHVSNAAVNGKTFPQECTAGALSAQEKVIEYMLFDLANCAPDNPPPPPSCTPKTCQQQGISCGPAGDGCGGLITSCGTCTGNQTCGGGGTPGQCGGPTCTPTTCAAQGYNCGLAGDGCGGQLNCGTCDGGTCGGGGANKCGGSACTPKTCAQLGIACGPAGDGCGNIIQCGPCTAPDTCGGAGVSGQCGHTACVPTTCGAQNANCGPIADGCGGIIDCGTCTAPQTCGGGGVANQCGGIK